MNVTSWAGSETARREYRPDSFPQKIGGSGITGCYSALLSIGHILEAEPDIIRVAEKIASLPHTPANVEKSRRMMTAAVDHLFGEHERIHGIHRVCAEFVVALWDAKKVTQKIEEAKAGADG